MKHILYLLAVLILGSCISVNSNRASLADTVTGAWELKEGTEEQVVLFTDGYFSHTAYNRETKKFIQTRGGTYTFTNGQLTINFEFDTKDKDHVGQTVIYNASIRNKSLETNINGSEKTWLQIDNGNGNLSGLWKITKRREEGNLVPIHQTGTRKTVKILTATRFQWAAIDPGKKEFLGTGGGTYAFSNGKYQENIEFFSRDSTRVGSSLSFDGRLEGGDWHHSGLSSRGEPLYEVWSRNKER